MTNLSAYTSSHCQPNLVDYQQELTLALEEIKTALEILENFDKTCQTNQQLSEKIDRVNHIVTQVTQRLYSLDRLLNLLPFSENTAQLLPTQAVHQVIYNKLEDIQKTVNQLQYSA